MALNQPTVLRLSWGTGPPLSRPRILLRHPPSPCRYYRFTGISLRRYPATLPPAGLATQPPPDYGIYSISLSPLGRTGNVERQALSPPPRPHTAPHQPQPTRRLAPRNHPRARPFRAIFPLLTHLPCTHPRTNTHKHTAQFFRSSAFFRPATS